MKYNDFDVIHAVVTLSRSGDYRSKTSLLRAMCKHFPGLNGEDILRICKGAINAMARNG